jgi:hypothetical protein
MPSHPHTSVIPRHAGRIIDLGKDVSLEQRARHQRSSALRRMSTNRFLFDILTRNVSGYHGTFRIDLRCLVGLDGCEVRLCVPCVLLCVRVSRV